VRSSLGRLDAITSSCVKLALKKWNSVSVLFESQPEIVIMTRHAKEAIVRAQGVKMHAARAALPIFEDSNGATARGNGFLGVAAVGFLQSQSYPLHCSANRASVDSKSSRSQAKDKQLVQSGGD
jgi:hypothetical protein